MAKIVNQLMVVSALIKALEATFKIPVYSDEVREKFRKPCFFVTASSSMEPSTDNIVEKELTVGFTYFPRDSKKNEICYLAVVDAIQRLFQRGIRVNDRYLHFGRIEDDRVGEEQDILQVNITIPFLERMDKPPAGGDSELMGAVHLTVKSRSDDGEPVEVAIWKSEIDSETI